MASIPLASTSRAVFAPAASPSRLLRRQLPLHAGYVAASRPICSVASTSILQPSSALRKRQQQYWSTHDSHRQQQQQQCRHSSSATGKGMGNRALPEESHVNPSTGLGGSNTEQSLLSKTHTNLGGGGGKALVNATAATGSSSKSDNRPSLSKTSGTAEVNWIAKQLDMMERRDNMKNEAPIKQDEDMPFALYVPPTSIPFRPFSEKWLTYYAGRLQNTAQSFRALRSVFGLRKYQAEKKKVVLETFIPLYQSVCRAQAIGDLSSLRGRISYGLRSNIIKNLSKLSARHPNSTFSWKWHGLDGAKVVSARQVEFSKDKATLQMTVRIESKQSLEIRNFKGDLVAGSGSHDKPLKVVENYVFQNQLYLGEKQPWTVVKSIPTLTPLQAIGKTDKRLMALYKQKRKVALTVTA